jgi:uncharacterized membrane protein
MLPETQKTLQNRLHSRAAWVTLGALFLLIGDTFGLWKGLGITSDAARGIIDGILAVAAAFGIFNDPTNKGAF